MAPFKILNTLKLAWYLRKLEDTADGNFVLGYSPVQRKWIIGYEGDLYSNFVLGYSLKSTLEYFLLNKVKK